MKAIELFEINIQRSEELLQLHKKTFPKGRPVATGVPADLLRAVVVFSVAAFDAYIQKRVTEVLKTYIHTNKKVPDKCVAIVGAKFKEKDGYRYLLNLSLQKDPENKILHLVEESLAGMTFQKPDQIQLLFDAGEIKDGWKQVNKVFQSKPGRKKKGRKQKVETVLLSLAERRDAIVHKNDMYFSNKHQGKIKSITRKQVTDELEKLRRITLAFGKITEI